MWIPTCSLFQPAVMNGLTAPSKMTGPERSSLGAALGSPCQSQDASELCQADPAEEAGQAQRCDSYIQTPYDTKLQNARAFLYFSLRANEQDPDKAKLPTHEQLRTLWSIFGSR